MEETMSAPVVNLESEINYKLGLALDDCKSLAQTGNSRELSLVMTKIEEAQLWLIRVKK